MIKVGDLQGAMLNYWVQRALGWKHLGAIGVEVRKHGDQKGLWCLEQRNDWWEDPEGRPICGPCDCIPYAYSTDWALAGPIIERRFISLKMEIQLVGVNRVAIPVWRARIEGSFNKADIMRCATPLIAAMRCFVADKLGAEFDETVLNKGVKL